jgi:hypothetical protein
MLPSFFSPLPLQSDVPPQDTVPHWYLHLAANHSAILKGLDKVSSTITYNTWHCPGSLCILDVALFLVGHPAPVGPEGAMTVKEGERASGRRHAACLSLARTCLKTTSRMRHCSLLLPGICKLRISPQRINGI